MFVKKFEAHSVEKALALVKDELGPDALIISTEKKTAGWLQKSMIEVTAAYEESEGDRTNNSKGPRDLSDIFPHRKSYGIAEETPATSIRKTSFNRYVDLTRPAPPATQLQRPNSHEQSFAAVGLSTQTSRELTQRLVFEYSQEDLSSTTFCEKAKLRLMLPSVRTLSLQDFCDEPTWTVIGPPGAGKTTVLVKLAMLLKHEGQRVSLVGLDKRKLLGTNELAAYAKLIQVPFGSRLGMGKDHTSIRLIDGPCTPVAESRTLDGGRGALDNSEVLLVLDATCRLEELLKTVKEAKDLHPRALVFTRLDQASNVGVIYDVLRKTKLPLLGSSLSRSFKVPFRFFEPEELLKHILKVRSVQ